MHHYIKSASGLEVQEIWRQQFFFEDLSPIVTLTFTTQPFAWHSRAWWCTTIQILREKLSDSENIIRTNILGGFEPSLCPWLWEQKSKIVIQYSNSWWCTTIYTKSSSKRFKSSGDMEETHTDTMQWHLKSVNAEICDLFSWNESTHILAIWKYNYI